MTWPKDLDRMAADDLDDWNRLQDRLSRFESWREANPAARARHLDEFLPPVGDPYRLPCLHELIKTDLEIRWRHGRRAVLEAYSGDFPELGTLSDLPPALIYEEYRVRLLYGDKPAPETYRDRFPKQYEAFREELARHIQDGSLPRHTPMPEKKSSSLGLGPLQGSAIPGVGSIVGGRYTLTERIGEGTFGWVFAAENDRGMRFAIKIIKPQTTSGQASMADSELKALEDLKHVTHSYLLKTFDYFWEQNHLVIVMERARETLQDIIKRTGEAIRIDQLLRYFDEAAEALDYLHAQGIIHRDVKPANILLMEDGHVRVADFSLAKALPEFVKSMRASRAAGTPAYMAPETYSDDNAVVHPAGDLFSLAVSYLELRLGHWPKDAKSKVNWIAFCGNKPDMEWIQGEERKVLSKALSVEPSERHPTCKAFVEELRRAIERKGGGSGLHRIWNWIGGSGERPAVRPRTTEPAHDPRLASVLPPGSQTRTQGGARPSVPSAPPPAPPSARPDAETPPPSIGLGTILPPRDQQGHPPAEVIVPGGQPTSDADIVVQIDDGWKSLPEVPVKREEKPATAAPRKQTDGPGRWHTKVGQPRPKLRRRLLFAALLGTAAGLGAWQGYEHRDRLQSWWEQLAQAPTTAPTDRGDEPAPPPPPPPPTAKVGNGEKLPPTPPPPPLVASLAEELASLDRALTAKERDWDKAPEAFQRLKERSDVKGNANVAASLRRDIVRLCLKHGQAHLVREEAPAPGPEGSLNDSEKVLGLLVHWDPDWDKLPEVALKQLQRAKPFIDTVTDGTPAAIERDEVKRRAQNAVKLLGPRLNEAPTSAEADRMARAILAWDGTHDAARRTSEAVAAIQEAARPMIASRRAVLEKLRAALETHPAWERELCDAIVDVAEPDGETLREAAELLAPLAKGPVAGHASYLAALRDRTTNKTAAADALVKASEGEAVGFFGRGDPAKAKARAQEAAKVLLEAAREQRRGGTIYRPFGDANMASVAWTWLQGGDRILKVAEEKGSVPFRLNAALAAWSCEKPDLKQVRELTAGLYPVPNEVTRDDRVSLMLAYANAHATGDGPAKRAALKGYAELADQVYGVISTDRNPTAAARQAYDVFLKQALALGEELVRDGGDTGTRSEAAKLSATLARLMTTYDDAGWESTDPKGTILALYERALALDDSRADYYLGRAWSRLTLGKRPWAQLSAEARADARQAIAKAEASPGGYHLEGYLLHLDSRRMVGREARVRTLREAIGRYTKALELSEADRENLPLLLIDRSNAYLELANYVAGDPKATREALGKAEKEATEAIRLARHHRELAWEALGNALEDFELLLQEKGKFAEAVDAFSRAHELRGSEPRFLIDRGRAQYRRVRLASEDPKLLTKATADLRKALGLKTSPLERTKAHDWLGLVLLRQGNIESSTVEFLNAASIALADGEAAAYSAEWLRFLFEQEASDEGLSPRHRLVLAAALRERAGAVKKAYPREAALAKGRSSLLENKPREALKALSEGLPTNLAQATQEDIELLLARADIQIDRRNEGDLRPGLRDWLAMKEEARHLLRLTAGDDISREVKGRAFGFAGLVSHKLYTSEDYEAALRMAAAEAGLEQLRQAFTHAPKHGSSIYWRINYAAIGVDKLQDPRLSAKARQDLYDTVKEQLEVATTLDIHRENRGKIAELKEKLAERKR